MTDLRALAEAANLPDRYWFGQGGRPKPLGVTWEESAYIAAASPSVVLALLDCVDAARALEVEWRGEEYYSLRPNQAFWDRDARAIVARMLGDEA